MLTSPQNVNTLPAISFEKQKSLKIEQHNIEFKLVSYPI